MVADQVESECIVACYVLFSLDVGVDFGYDHHKYQEAETNPSHIHHPHRESILRPRPSTRRGAGRHSAFGDVGRGQVEYLSEECAGGEGGGGYVEEGE